MAIIYSYPLTTPKVKDLLIGTSVFDEDDENSPRNNPTVSFTIKSLLDMIGTGGFQTLQQVTNLGASTTNAITIANGLSVTGTFTDSTGGVGTAGQVLSSTNIGTAWINDNAGLNYYVTGAAFDTTTGILAITGNNALVGASIDLDGRYMSSLTTTGTTGASTFNAVTGVLNIPNYVGGVTSVNSSLLFAYKGILVTPTSGAVVVGLNINDLPSLPAAIADEDVMVIVDDPSGTGAGVKNHKTTVGDLKTHINTNTTYALASDETTTISLTSASPVGAAGAVELAGAGGTTVAGTGDIITITSTEIDTLQSVTARGPSSSIATNFTGGLTVNGAGAGAYFYVGGNAQATAPPLTYDTGMAMVWNNSGGARENEIYYATGGMSTIPAADRQGVNDTSFFAFINRFNPLGTPTDTTTMKLYGSGLLELVGPTATATISRPGAWIMPTIAGTDGYVLAKATGSHNLEWVANGGSGGVTGSGTLNKVPRWTATGSDLGDGPIIFSNATTTADSTFGGDVSLADDKALILGNTPDCKIFFDSTASVLANSTVIQSTPTSATGAILLQSYNVKMRNQLGTANMFHASQGGSVILYYDGDIKLETTNSGIKFNGFGSGTKTGTPTYNLSVDSTGNVIETPASQTGASLVYTQAYTAANLFTGGTQAFNVTGGVPVGKQLLIENLVYYLDYGGTSFDYISTDVIQIIYLDGSSSIIGPKINDVDTFMNTIEDVMTEGYFTFSASIFPHLLGAVVVGASPGSFELSLPTATPTVGNGTLYVSMQYKLLDTGASFSL
jgi:hypothetical protein